MADITSVSIAEELRTSFRDYSMSVIIGRALPDVRDGLKPVHRRILYAMFSEGLLSSRKFSKKRSQKIIMSRKGTFKTQI